MQTNMKLAIVAVCFAALASLTHGVNNSEILKAIQECKHENKCRENILMVLRNKEIPKTDEGFKTLYCAGQEIKMITDENTINAEVMQSVLTKMNMNPATAAKVTAECQSEFTGDDHVTAAKSLMTCVHNHSQKQN